MSELIRICFEFQYSDLFRNSKFGFVSEFEIRISNLLKV